MNILFLVHRIPYPPNKGDKIRSYHVLRHLSEKHQVYLAGFYDDPRDAEHVEKLSNLARKVRFEYLGKYRPLISAPLAFARGRPITLEAFRNQSLLRWVRDISESDKLDAVFVFSSSMGQYLDGARLQDAKVIVDLVDVDSEKWFDYARRSNIDFLMKYIYLREGRLLRKYELDLACRADVTTLVSDQERRLFIDIAEQNGIELSENVRTMRNGVDFEYFDPSLDYANPYTGNGPNIVFTGAMDYWANIDGVEWFVRKIFPEILSKRKDAVFHIVGSNPDRRVWALSGEHVNVTGYVDDVRPYLRHADVAVCPLRIARGIQNKVIEAMAMGLPVVATPEALTGIEFPELDELSASEENAFAQNVNRLVADQAFSRGISLMSRKHVLERFSWASSLQPLDELLES